MPGNSAITIGNVMITGRSLDRAFADRDFMNHEDRHSSQWMLLGPVGFITSWAAGGGASCGNPLEQSAGMVASSGYSGCGW